MGVATLPMPHVEGVEHRRVAVDGLTIHYAEAGEGEPLVLLHGWPQHWWAWREVIAPLAERYRVIAPDIRGIGWSDPAPDDDYRFRTFGRDLVGLLDVLGIERTRLVGHDWGLAAGYMACLDRPDRIERFVPMGGPHIWSREGAPPRIYLRPWHTLVNATVGELATRRLGVPETCLRTWRHRGEFTPEEIEIYTSPLRRPASARATRLRYRTFMTQELPMFARHYRRMRLRVPTLHLNGAEDPLTIGTPDSWRRYADDMRFETVPDCGHFLAEEQPDETLDRVTEFLRGG